MSNKSYRSIVSIFMAGMILLLVATSCAPAATPTPTQIPPTVAPPTAAPPTAAPKPTDAPKPTETAKAAATSAPAATVAPTVAPTAPPAAKPAAPIATAASRANLKGELVLNTWRDIGADPNHPNYTFHLLIQAWAANHPGVTVKYQPMLGTVTDIFGYIATNLRSKTLSDGVVMLYPSPAQMDADLQYDFAAELAKPNPYSTNKTWRDDFGLNGIALTSVTTQNKVLMVSNTFIGNLGDGAILYNQDILDKAGVKALPKTWNEFVDAMKKIKAAGFQPLYMPTAGNENYIFSWQTGIWAEQLLGSVIKACDGQAGEKADGRITQVEAVWCLKKGKWSSKDMRPLFELTKDMSQYFHDGYLAPPAPGDPFVQGKVAFRWLSRLNVSTVAADPNIKFKWGSFYEPALKDGGTLIRYGTSAAGAGGQYLFIPKTAVDKGKLDLLLDLAQYATSPKANDYWCSLQPVPCFAQGATVESVFPTDKTKQEIWRGYIEPGVAASGLDVNNTFGPANGVQEIKVFQDYLGGTLTLDQALVAWQRMVDQLTENTIRQHPEWKADTW